MTIAVLLLLVVAVLGSAGMAAVLTALFMRTRQPRLPGGTPNDLRLLQNEVQRLGDELDRTTTELEHLRERMDFTERLLGPGPADDE
jgi:hypothetical protein